MPVSTFEEWFKLNYPLADDSFKSKMREAWLAGAAKERVAVLLVCLRQQPNWKWGHVRRLVESDARNRGTME